LIGLKVVVGPVDAIPLGEGREYRIAGEHLAIFHLRNGGVYATQALCPHKQGPLADGLTGESVVSCPFHGWKFNLKSGEHADGTCRLQTYEVSVNESGMIELTLPGRDL
jgi:nitrite reductase (NADH) small subunit